MKKVNKFTADNRTFIGNLVPFFLNNLNLSTYYLYQITTPGVTEDLTPLLTLKKISEKVGGGDFSSVENGYKIYHGDILSTLINSRKRYLECATSYLSDLVSNDSDYYLDHVSYKDMIYSNGYDFPTFELDENNNNLTKQIIISLRDSLRWKKYKFLPGYKVDILVSPNKFAVFNLVGGANDSMKLVPENMYEIDDVNLKNPINNVNWNKVDYPKVLFYGNKSKRASDLNRAIRLSEWRALLNN